MNKDDVKTENTIHGDITLSGDWSNTTVYSFTKVERPLANPRLTGVPTQGTIAAITVSSLDTSGEHLDDLLERQLAAIAGQLPEFDLVENEERDVNGKKIVSYAIRFMGPDGRKLRQRSEHLPWNGGGVYTVVTLTATEETFDRFREELTRIVESFKTPESKKPEPGKPESAQLELKKNE